MKHALGMHIKEKLVDNDVEDLSLEGIVNKPKDATWLKLFDYCMEDLDGINLQTLTRKGKFVTFTFGMTIFFETPMYDEIFFKWHHIIKIELFLKVMNVVVNYDYYFVQKKDILGS